MSVDIEANFINDFKLGDNIKFNLKGLEYFYELYKVEKEPQKTFLRRVMIIQIGACCEAVFHDFFKRAKDNVREGVQNLSEEVLETIRSKKYDKFAAYIDLAQRYDFFDVKEGEGKDMYKVLHDLRKLRNRIHIQNEKDHFQPDDKDAFNDDKLDEAEKLLEAIFKVMSKKYKRPIRNYIGNFVLPWEEKWIGDEF